MKWQMMDASFPGLGSQKPLLCANNGAYDLCIVVLRTYCADGLPEHDRATPVYCELSALLGSGSVASKCRMDPIAMSTKGVKQATENPRQVASCEETGSAGQPA
jgi:hypothetical protein